MFTLTIEGVVADIMTRILFTMSCIDNAVACNVMVFKRKKNSKLLKYLLAHAGRRKQMLKKTKFVLVKLTTNQWNNIK